jgi:hypothetical protein
MSTLHGGGRYEAKKVVTQLLKYHKAWGYIPKESKRRERQTEAEPESQGWEARRAESHVMADQQIRFESEPRGESEVVLADAPEDG